MLQGRLLLKEGRLRESRGKYGNALRWYGRALRKVDESAGDGLPTRVEIELAYASVRQRQGRFADTIDWCNRAATDAETAGHRAGIAHAYYLLDMAHIRLGEPTRHRGLALPIYEEIGDLVGQAKVLINLGIDAYYAGDWDEAIDCYSRGREISQRAGDVVHAAIAHNNAGELLADQGKLDEARAVFEDALRTFRAARYAPGIPLSLANLGRVAARAGRFEEARQVLEQALAGWAEIGNATWVLETDVRLAERALLAGEHDEAERIAATAAASAGATALGAAAERFLGYALAQAGRLDEARPHFARSLELAAEVGAAYEEALTLKALADTGATESRSRSDELLAGLGVVWAPSPPLPAVAAR